MNIFKQTIEDFKAWRRGEIRVQPRGVTGRIYALKETGQPEGGAAVNVKTEPIASLHVKVIRADGTVEDLGELNGR
jgi:hypothetical protein